MRRNIEKTITAFLTGRSHKERTCSTDGQVLKSYLMPIAYRNPDTGVVLLVEESASPSSTTDSQIRALDFTCAVAKIECQRVTDCQLRDAQDA